jgi:hypothetical protein
MVLKEFLAGLDLHATPLRARPLMAVPCIAGHGDFTSRGEKWTTEIGTSFIVQIEFLRQIV